MHDIEHYHDNEDGQEAESKQNKPIIIYGGPLFDGKKDVWEDGCVFVADGKVKLIGSEEEVFEKAPKNIDMEVYNTQGKIIFPGLINLHHHFYSAFSKGLVPSAPVTNFHERLKYFWWRLDKALDKEIIQLSALASLLDCIRYGVTTVFDHHASPTDVRGSLEVIGSVIKRSGIRAALCYEISDRDGKDVFHRGIEENLNFIEKYKNDDSLKGILGLHANFTLSEKSMTEIEQNYDPEVGIHIHCGEDSIDAKYCRKLGYKGGVDRLNKFNLLSKKSILAHGIHLLPEEIMLIEKSGAVLVHNPESNMNNAVGRLPFPLPEKVNVGLGTDGMTSNMLLTLRSGFLSHRQAGIDDGVLFSALPKTLFEINGRIAGRFFDGKPGVLEPGANADIAVFDYVPLTPIHSGNLTGHILYGMYDAPATMVMAKGRMIYEDGAFLTLDKEIIVEESRKASERLWRKYADLK
ncbi:MAG: chlorohydrolase [Candidatus Marinimicrobia bacterium CG08_land_8_20_14_0_20_45_22]|nr:MAG: chlorohydrolase [Candidatus Marinimicrobia bacterium CG08_land_8_20_14_0_20_45_22]